MTRKVDFVSVLYDILLSWLKTIGILLVLSLAISTLFSLLQEPVGSLTVLKRFFGNFFVVTIISSLFFMPCLFIQTALYKDMILSSRMSSRKSVILGSGSGFAYGVLFSALLTLAKSSRDISEYLFILPLFGAIAGAGLGYYIFPRVKNRYYPLPTEEKEILSESKESLVTQGKLRFSALVDCLLLAFLNSIFCTTLSIGAFVVLLVLMEGNSTIEAIFSGLLIFLLTLAVGTPFGIIIALPCLVMIGFVYSWLYKHRYMKLIWWVAASLFVGQFYVLILYAVDNKHFLTGLSKFFYIPVSILTGYFSWKKLNGNNPGSL